MGYVFVPQNQLNTDFIVLAATQAQIQNYRPISSMASIIMLVPTAISRISEATRT